MMEEIAFGMFSIHHIQIYMLPISSSGGVLAADSDECGSGTTFLSSAYTPEIDRFGYPWSIHLEFDNDWNAISFNDTATAEISIDDGNTWIAVFVWAGIDVRNTQEYFDLTSLVGYNEFQLRFRSVQPEWAWWWAVDNVKIAGEGPITPPFPPRILNVISDSSDLKVHLNWNNGFCPDPITGYEIQRKDGLPLNTTSYTILAVANKNTFSFSDSTVLRNSIYTYKIRTLCGPPGSGSIWGKEATAYVPDIITPLRTKNELPTEFYLEQNYPNPFNNYTITFQILDSTKKDW